MAINDIVFGGGEPAPAWRIPIGAGPDVVPSTGFTLLESVALLLAESAGERSGAGTATETFKDPTGTKTRFTAAVDEDGNRVITVVDPTP
jgi:hypothetical protein